MLKIQLNDSPPQAAVQKIGSSFFMQYMLTLVSVFVLALILSLDIWKFDVISFHTVIESISIMMALSTFILVWSTYKYNSKVNEIIGYGFFVIVFFNILHTVFFMIDTYVIYHELSIGYWIIANLTEALIFLLSQFKLTLSKKWAGIFFVVVAACTAAWYIFIQFNDIPIIILKSGIYAVKALTGYAVVLILIITLIIITVTKRYRKPYERFFFLAVHTAIIAEFCFTSYTSEQSVLFTYGHLLKAVYYYYLFRSIFINAVVYPYEKLRGDRRYLYDILDSIPVGLITYSSDLKVSFINKVGLDLMACTREEVHGLTSEQFTKKFKLDDDDVSVRQMQVTNSCHLRGVRTALDGNGDLLRLMVDILPQEDGGYLCLYKNAKDEQKLENLELQTQTILNSISNTVTMLDNSGKILMCNRALEQTTEMTSGEILGMQIENYYQILNYSCRLQNDLAHKETSSYEIGLVTLAGNKKELLEHQSDIVDLDGEVIGSIIIGTDITNMKEAQSRLRQQDKLALLGQMGASIVHETKNMLASIKGYSQLITLKEANGQIKDYARKIDYMTDEVNRVIVEFLELSKPREFVPVKLHLNGILESIKYMLESSAIVKGIDMKIELDSEEKPVLCDESQIKQVMLNMVKNAVEAVSDISDPKLVVQTSLDKKTDEMLIIISDNGKGMSKEVVEKLGTPFFTTKKTGTGLGLNLCYQIIKEHNGQICVESSPGEGTTFTVSIPCCALS